MVSVCFDFDGCRQPVPFMVWEFPPGEQPTLKQLLEPVVKEINYCGMTLRNYCADGKEQQHVRGMVTTNGYYACARCSSKGAPVRRDPSANSQRQPTHVHYPLRAHNSQPRDYCWQFDEIFFSGCLGCPAMIMVQVGAGGCFSWNDTWRRIRCGEHQVVRCEVG